MTNQADDRDMPTGGPREVTSHMPTSTSSTTRSTGSGTRVHFPSTERMDDDDDDDQDNGSMSNNNTSMTGSNVGGIMNPVSTPTISVNRANAYAQDQRKSGSGPSVSGSAKMTPGPIMTNGPGMTGSSTTTTTSTSTTSTSPGSRRTPARPSPLSRLHSSPGPSTLDTVRSGNHTYTQRQAGQMMDSTHSHSGMGYSSSPMSGGLGGSAGAGSPCFVHSHLEKYSQLDDRVRQKLAGYGVQGGDHRSGSSGSYGASQGQGAGSGGGNGPRSMGGDRSRDGGGQDGSYHYRSGGGITFESSRSGGGAGGSGNRNGLSSMFGYNSDGPTPRFSSPASSGTLDRGDDGFTPIRSGNHDGDREGSGRHKICAPSPSDLDDAEDGGSLTRQLAETATGVREMSKQLGRTKVKSNIQSVLIVTKARDNRLIKLTREVAVYLMQMKRSANSERGMIVYVDAQLKTSKRFDATGLRESNPEFFKPLYRRRSSSTASMSTMSGFVSDASGYVSRSSSRRANGASGSSGPGTGEEGQLRYWTSEMCSSQPHLFDMVVTLGGDGTVLFTSWLFQRIVPPVLPFALGSLGFLTNFDFADYAKTLDKAVDDGIRVNLRMRFTCTVYRAVTPEQAAVASGQKRKAIKSTGGDILISQVDAEGWEALEGTKPHEDEKKAKAKRKKEKEIMCFSTRPVETFEVLNDLVVDRGPSPYVSLLELFGDDHHLTTVQADGLCVATPTGSTAYSLSAGGSLVHPGIPALLISPICPHTLSFRPMLLPDGMELRVCVPYNSRSTAWASFDGRGRVELKQGDHIKIAASKYPFPTICRDKQSTDWFNSISRTLRWNEREKQKSFVVVEEDRANPVKEKTKKKIPRDEHIAEDRGGNENIRVDKPGKASGQMAESGLDDKARVEASKKEADMGFKRMADMGDKVSAQQEKFRGGHPDEDDEDDSGEDDEEEEEEEEEGFDIDDVSEEPPTSSSPESDKTPSEDPKPVAHTAVEPAPSHPPYSTKRPSHLLTKMLSMTSQGGDGGYDDPGMKSGVETPDRFGAPYDPTRVSPKSPEAFARKLDAGLNEALHDKQQHHPHPNIRRTSSRREDMHQDSSTSDDVSSDLTEKTRAMGISDEISQGYSSNSLHPNSRMLPASPVDPMLSPSARRTRSRSRSRSRSVTRGSAYASMPRDTSSSSARRLKSTSRSRTRSERTVGAQTETPNESEKDTEREDNGDRLEFVRPGRPSRNVSSASTITVHHAQGAIGTSGHDVPLDGIAGSRSGSSSTERRPSIDKLRTPRASDYANVMNSTSRAGFLDPETVEEEDEEDEEEHHTRAFCFYGEDESESGQSDGESEA